MRKDYTRAIGADWKFVEEQFSITSIRGINPINRLRALGLGIGLGVFATPKTLIKLAQPMGFAEIKMWYGISNNRVNNKPL